MKFNSEHTKAIVSGAVDAPQQSAADEDRYGEDNDFGYDGEEDEDNDY